MTRKLVIDLSQAAGLNTVPLEVKLADGRLLRFDIPERTDTERARLVQQLESLPSDTHTRDLAATWLLECAQPGVTLDEVREVLRKDTTLSQVLALLLTGRLPDPKVLDRLMTRMLDRLTADMVKGI